MEALTCCELVFVCDDAVVLCLVLCLVLVLVLLGVTFFALGRMEDPNSDWLIS